MTTTTYTPKQIVAFGCTPQSVPVTVATALTLAAGQAVGVVTASGLAVAWDSTASDGSETLVGFLAERVDTTDAGETLIADAYMADGILYLDQLVGVTGFEEDLKSEFPHAAIMSARNLLILG